MDDSRYIPAEVRRAVLMESGYCCAVPTCPLPVDILHHIKWFSKGGPHTVENLIGLCVMHHKLVHDGIIDTKSVKAYKEQLKQYQPKLAKVQAELAEMRGKVEAVPGLVMENEQLKARIAVLEERTAQAGLGEAKDHLGLRLDKLEDAHRMFVEAAICIKREQYSKALDYLEVCQKVEESWGVLHNLGVVYHSLRRYSDALSAYNQAEQLLQEQGSPEYAGLKKNRGNVFSSLGMYEEALVEYENSARVRLTQGLPEDPDLSTNRGVIYDELGKHREALEAYDKAEFLRKEQGLPIDSDLITNRAVVYIALDRNEEALVLLEEVEVLRSKSGLPRSAGVIANRGIAYEKLGRYKDALTAYDVAEALLADQGLPNEPNLDMFRALVYLRMQDTRQACHFASKAANEFSRLELPQPLELLQLIEEICD